jgi:hypothetical protein
MDHKREWTWGWNGDICAVWAHAIVLGETRAEKEKKATLIAAAPDKYDACDSALLYLTVTSDRLRESKKAELIAFLRTTNRQS